MNKLHELTESKALRFSSFLLAGTLCVSACGSSDKSDSSPQTKIDKPHINEDPLHLDVYYYPNGIKKVVPGGQDNAGSVAPYIEHCEGTLLYAETSQVSQFGNTGASTSSSITIAEAPTICADGQLTPSDFPAEAASHAYTVHLQK